MTTVSEVIATCRNDYLQTGGTREARNRLDGAIDASTTTLTVEFDPQGITDGAKLSIGLEDMGVWNANPSSRTATIQRADYGSLAGAHASGDIVFVNAEPTSAQILRAINAELLSLSSPGNGLFQMKTVDLSYNASLSGYDLSGVTNLNSVWAVRYRASGSEKYWPMLHDWEYQRDMASSEFTSTHAIFINQPAEQGQTVRVWYRSGFTSLFFLTDDILAVSGLHTEAHDILSIGAAWRLTAGREVSRNITTSQGDTRRASEVPPGAQLGASRNMAAVRKQRIDEEKTRLARRYPVRI